MIGPEVKKTAYEIESDKAALRQWITRDTNVPDLEYDRMKRTVALAIREELSPTQQEYLTMYYYDKLTMDEIAKVKGVNKSTVCRTINRAENRIAKVMRYAFPQLRGPVETKRRRNKRKKDAE